jgi:mRNA interferase RelE/StbE
VYGLRLRPEARRGLTRIDAAARVRVAAAIDELKSDPRPRGVKKLVGDLWRIRVGDSRIIYEIRDEVLVVLVVRVAHRREVYR